MNKAQLVDEIADQTGETKKQADAIRSSEMGCTVEKDSAL